MSQRENLVAWIDDVTLFDAQGIASGGESLVGRRRGGSLDLDRQFRPAATVEYEVDFGAVLGAEEIGPAAFAGCLDEVFEAIAASRARRIGSSWRSIIA